MTVACFFQLCLRMFVPLLCSLLHFLSLSVCLFLSNNISIQSCSLIFCEKSVSIEQVEMVQFIYLSVSLSVSMAACGVQLLMYSHLSLSISSKIRKKNTGNIYFIFSFHFRSINHFFFFLFNRRQPSNISFARLTPALTPTLDQMNASVSPSATLRRTHLSRQQRHCQAPEPRPKPHLGHPAPKGIAFAIGEKHRSLTRAPFV